MSGRRLLYAGAVTGVGLSGFVDEVVFHQLLHWHHLWDDGSAGEALTSDGGFHAFETLALAAGLLWLAHLRRQGALAWQPWIGGLLVGAGGFQLYDGIVNHKILRLHQVRYHVPSLLPYDVAWDASGVVLLLAGVVVLRAVSRRRSRN